VYLKKQAAILLLFFFIMIKMQAQPPAFYHLSTAEGLSDNNVNMAARDRNGILWIATTEGLNSFDGNRITTYHKYKYPALADNNIDRILIDDKNRIWIRTNTHYVTMLDEKRKFHKILVGDTTDKTNVTSLLYTSSKGVFAVKGRQHYFQKKDSIGIFEKTNTPFDDLLKGSIGFTYSIDKDKIIYYRNSNLVVIDYAQMKPLLQLPLPGLNGAHYINEDELIAFTIKGDVFYRISISEKKIVKEYHNIKDQYNLPISGNLRNMTRIDANHFAFTTYFAGLYILDLEKEIALHWSHDPVDHRSIGGNNTFNIRYDTSGYLFVTTQTSGLHFYNVKQQHAISKPYFIDDNKQIFDGYIQSVVTDDASNVWMGAQDRLIKWNRLTDKTVYVPCLLPDGTNISGRETIREVHLDERNNLWVGTSKYGILILNKELKTIKQVTDSTTGKKTDLPAAWINAICADKYGNRWAATLRGTCMINKNNFEITSFANHPVLAEMSKLPAASLWLDNTGKMWIGTTKGAWCYDDNKNSIVQYSTNNGLPHNTVYAINQDKLGNTYFATLGGLAILSADGKITSFNRSTGLRNDRCEGLLLDEKGYIWIGNLNCILRYDPVNKKFAVYEEGVGFSHAGFRMRVAYKSNSGEMFWGTDKGLTYFYPDQMSSTPLPLHPAVNTLQAGDELFQFTGKENIRLPYNTSSFVFIFSSGELSGDKRNQFLYRLVGFDKAWKSPVTVGEAVYSKLPSGDYTFEVKVSRDGITWYKASYPVEIIINRPWWQQIWFRLLVALLAISIIYYTYVYFQKRKQTKELERTIDYFASSAYEHSSVEDILWDISRNCISRLGFEDCVIYLTDEENKVLVQKAAYGPKNPNAFEILNLITIPFGKGIVGSVALSGKGEIIGDTSRDSRYIVDDEKRLSEITVPIIHEGKVIGIIDSENRKKNFFTNQHLKTLQTIASLCAAKISHAIAMGAIKQSKMELMELNVKMAESRFSNLRLQMNPHFLFNSLSSIQHLIVSQQTTKAYKYLTVFSNFLRTLLNFAEKNFIPLDEEIKILKMYIELESLRFDQSFNYEIIVDESLSNDEVLMPTLMIQPFAENAIWHGLLHKEGDKKLSIRFSNSSEDFLTCIIEDNGVGRASSTAIQKSKISSAVHESKGIGIIRERLDLMVQKTGKPANVAINDLYNEAGEPTGTKVIITIPYYNPEES
jgi:ligand-binding sensor domain-containing protein/putative methionine-R-sulfoxide reductase with GAF domain